MNGDTLFSFRNKSMGKRGWVRILEATIAVLIISTTMLAVYSGQGTKNGAVASQSSTIQKQVLDDISSNTSLRLDALNVITDLPGDPSYDKLTNFTDTKIPVSLGYLLRVCNLSTSENFCKMDSKTFIATEKKDVTVDSIIISADIGNGSNAIYSPKDVRLFTWSGKLPAEFCRDECSNGETKKTCSADSKKITTQNCVLNTTSGCWEFQTNSGVACTNGKSCTNGVCVGGTYSKWVCRNDDKTIVKTGCVYSYDDECTSYDGGQKTGGCGFFGSKDSYQCWNYAKTTTACSANPACPTSYPIHVRTETCTPPACVSNSWSPSPSTICAGNSFTQTSNCGTTRSSIGTEDCIASLTATPHLENTVINGGSTTEHYDILIKETGGVSATIKTRQKCYKVAGICGPLKTDIYSYLGANKISANGKIQSLNSQYNHYWGTVLPHETMTETFTGIDGNGHSISFSYEMQI